jgi:hypothetical protein
MSRRESGLRLDHRYDIADLVDGLSVLRRP